MTETLDISTTMTGRQLPRDQAKVVAIVKGHALEDHNFIRGRFREKDMDADTDYVLVQKKGTLKWYTYKLEDLNRDILKESANVP